MLLISARAAEGETGRGKRQGEKAAARRGHLPEPSQRGAAASASVPSLPPATFGLLSLQGIFLGGGPGSQHHL